LAAIGVAVQRVCQTVSNNNMTVEQIISNYILTDGQINSITVNFNEEPSAIVTLNTRKRNPENGVEDVTIDIRLNTLTHFDIVEDFESRSFSDLTLTRLTNGEYYLSLDPYDNSNQPNERDNFVFKCKTLTIGEQ
jgi:hypothetical protein